MSRGTILIADDEAGLGAVTAIMLDGVGFSTLFADNGDKAVELFSKNQERIIAVLLDMNMPGPGFGATIKRLKTINPGVKIIVTSAIDSAKKLEEIEILGSHTFLSKPFNRKQLLDTIRTVCGLA